MLCKNCMFLKLWIKKVLNAFITSQFTYVPVIWVSHNQKLNKHMNHIPERALEIVYQDHDSMFVELLGKYGSFKFYDCYLKKLLKHLRLKWMSLPKLWMKFLTF